MRHSHRDIRNLINKDPCLQTHILACLPCVPREGRPHAWSARNVLEWISSTRMSAGTFAPTAMSTMSPGTRSHAGMTVRRFPRSTIATSACAQSSS